MSNESKSKNLYRFIFLHLACLLVFYTGVSTTAVVTLVIVFCLRAYGISMGFHRYFAHHSFKTSRVFQFILALLGTSAGQRGPLWWAAIHRQHHKYSDVAGDHHSPHHLSFFEAHIGWVLKTESLETDYSLVRDLAKYPELVFLDNNHSLVQGLTAVSLFLLGVVLNYFYPALNTSGLQLLVFGFIIATILNGHTTLIVNSVGHLYGSRSFDTGSDKSVNVWWLALLTFGDGWHNNHHAFQSSARHGIEWYQLDINYLTLKVLEFLGIVWDLKIPSAEQIDRKRLPQKAC